MKKKNKKDVLVIVDMQNDFITGSLGSPQAQAILQPVSDFVRDWHGEIIMTYDTHHEGTYLQTDEGRKLPIPHCIQYTEGWMYPGSLWAIIANKKQEIQSFCKESHGTLRLAAHLLSSGDFGDIHIIGLCTCICVLGQAIVLKSAFPEKQIFVHRNLCAGVTNESHIKALEIMEGFKINVI